MIAQVTPINFKIHGDDRGSLISIEHNIDIPFSVNRTYYIYNTAQSISRGFHAHKKLKQVLIAVSGSVTILCEYKHKKEFYQLNSPEKGLYINGIVWREMHNFSSDCVLLVLASEHYDESDYIRSYNEFKDITSSLINN